MNRFLAFVGAFALAAAQPAVTLGAHPAGGVGISRPAMPAPAPRPAAPGGFSNQAPANIPFHINVQPPIHVDVQPPLRVNVQPIRMEPQHFTVVHPAAFARPSQLSPYRWYRWQPMPAYLWYPGGSAWNGPACLSQNSALNPPDNLASQDFSIGSLVDGKANLLSPQSYNPGFATGNSPEATSSSPLTFSVGFYPTACGAPGFTSW